MAWIEHRYADAGELATRVAAQLHAACADALAGGGRARLALAGGRTPWPIYAQLARADLDWPRVSLLPTDERCVPHGDPACNLRGLAEAFAAASGVRLDSLTVADGAPAASETHAQAMLAAEPQPFSAVLLGMGGDGHTASLFPGAARLAHGFDPARDACRIDPDPLPPEAPFPRISLTVARLLRTRALHLVITGADKRAVLATAMAANDPLRLPVAAILHAPGAPVHVHWSP